MVSTAAQAHDADDSSVAPSQRQLPAGVLCFPQDSASGDRHACETATTDGAQAIDLKAPFRHFDQPNPQQTNFSFLATSSAKDGESLIDIAGLVNAMDSLSKSDLLLLRATTNDAGPLLTPQAPTVEERHVSGIKDYGTGDDRGSWTLRPEVPAYLANEAAGLRIATQSVRELRNSIAPTASVTDDNGFSFWLRAVGNEDELGGMSGLGFNSTTDTTLMHAGADYAGGTLFGEGDRLHLGLMVTYGRSVSESGTDDSTAHAFSKVDAARAGGYVSWAENEIDRTGFSFDTWFGASMLKNSVLGDDLPGESYNAYAWAGSLQAAYGWRPFDTNLRVEPHAELLFARYEQPTHTEVNGTAIDGDAGGFGARLGLRVEDELRLLGSVTVKPFAEVNWRHDFSRTSIAFDQVVIGESAPEDRFEFNVGLDAKIDNAWTLAFNLQTEQGIADYEGVEALVSVKCGW